MPSRVLFPFFLRLEVGPRIQLMGLGLELLAPLSAGEKDICSHQTRSLGSEYTITVCAQGAAANTFLA